MNRDVADLLYFLLCSIIFKQLNKLDYTKRGIFLKLLVTASTFPRWENDTEPRFVLDLCKQMTKWYDVTVLVPAAPGAIKEETLEGIRVIRYHYFPIHAWETLCYPGAIVPRIKEKRIRALLVPFLFISLYLHLLIYLPQYDIVHAHWLIPQGIIQSLFKKPYIVTGHGGDVMSLNKGIIAKWKKHCLKKAKKVTVVSDLLKTKVQELAPTVNPAVISMGIDASKFGKQYYVENYWGQKEKKVVLFVGRLVEIKGVTYLIDAMRKVDAVLVIVGDGPLREELEKKANTINREVIFMGARSHDELKQIYASADIFAAPSITASDGAKEGLGLVILEAMASGLPVVASDSGGISQVIEDSVNGLLCEEKNIKELSEKITLLLTDGNMRSKLLKNAEKTIQKFDYCSLAAKYAEIMK